jgi:hypothetical protein
MKKKDNKEKIDINYLYMANGKDLELIQARFNSKKYYIDIEELRELIETRRIDFYEEKLDNLFYAAFPYINEKLEKQHLEFILPDDQPSLSNVSIAKRLFLFAENQIEYINENDTVLFDFLDRIDEILEGKQIFTDNGKIYWYNWFTGKTELRSDITSPIFEDDPFIRMKFRSKIFTFKDSERFINHFEKLRGMKILDKIDIEESDTGIQLYLYLQ